MMLGLVPALVMACAVTHPPAPSGERRVDAVLPSGKHLFLFDFARARYQKWPLEPCRLRDTLGTDWNATGNWLALPAPSRPFAPMRALGGPGGNFYLLDRAGRRLLHYDDNAQYLSSLPLPRELNGRPLDRLEVFRDVDGAFFFLDPGEGLAWQFEEIAVSQGPGDWRAINRVRLPLGFRGCVWRPWSRSLCCARPTAQGGPACFDRYFTATGPWNDSLAETPEAAPRPASDASAWVFPLPVSACPDAGPPVPICHHPDKAALGPCPGQAPGPDP